MTGLSEPVPSSASVSLIDRWTNVEWCGGRVGAIDCGCVEVEDSVEVTAPSDCAGASGTVTAEYIGGGSVVTGAVLLIRTAVGALVV